VRVDAKKERPAVGVSEPRGGGSRGNAGVREPGCVRVPEDVRRDARESGCLDDALEPEADTAVPGERLSLLVCEDGPAVEGTTAGEPVPAESRNGFLLERDFAESRRRLRLADVRDGRGLAQVEPVRSPDERQRLREPEPRRDEQRDERSSRERQWRS
jgi:hypothetical protein